MVCHSPSWFYDALASKVLNFKMHSKLYSLSWMNYKPRPFIPYYYYLEGLRRCKSYTPMIFPSSWIFPPNTNYSLEKVIWRLSGDWNEDIFLIWPQVSSRKLAVLFLPSWMFKFSESRTKMSLSSEYNYMGVQERTGEWVLCIWEKKIKKQKQSSPFRWMSVAKT